MSKQPPPAPTASTVGPCFTTIQIVGRPGTGRNRRKKNKCANGEMISYHYYLSLLHSEILIWDQFHVTTLFLVQT